MSRLPPNCCIRAIIPGMPIPSAERLPVLVSGGFLSSLPVIADDQTQSLAHTSEIDGDARRGGVAIHVGQCLLNNAEQRLLKR